MSRRFSLVLVVLMLLVAGGAAAALWYGSNLVIRPPWYEHRTLEEGLWPRDGDAFSIETWQGMVHDPLQDLGLAFESVEFPARDGTALRGWYVPGAAGATAGVVAVHGGGADRREFLRQVPVFHERGYPVLLFDCREQGISDGDSRGISLGIREHEDVSSAVAFAKHERGLERVAVIGTSQGGASVILAAAADSEIDAVIAENPFTSIPDLIAGTGSATGREMPEPLVALLAATAVWRMGARDDVPAPIEVVGRIAPRPLLLMHGDADSVIPVEQSRRLHEASNGGAMLWIAPGARHARLFNSHPEEWTEQVQTLLADGIGPAAPHGGAEMAP